MGMRLNKSKGRMFPNVHYTATYYMGCDHGCKYCWATLMGLSHTPRLVNKDTSHRIRVRDCTVFLNSAHDSFANIIPTDWILKMVEWMRNQHPSITFYLQTKNPKRAESLLDWFKGLESRVVFGTTIETDSAELCRQISKAPPPRERAEALGAIRKHGFQVWVSHEPLYRFNHQALLDLDRIAGPRMVMVGLDNYSGRHGLNIPGPTRSEYMRLRTHLIERGVEVVEKKSIVDWTRRTQT